VQVAGAYCQYALFCLLVTLFTIQQTSYVLFSQDKQLLHQFKEPPRVPGLRLLVR
jgi:hypothetical protein